MSLSLSQSHFPHFSRKSLAERDADRALYAKARKMRDKMPLKAVAAFLELPVSTVYTLLGRPPPSEVHLDQWAEAQSEYAEFGDAMRAERREEERRWHEARRQRRADEAHEVKAQAVHCLIEAFVEMAPYVGTEA